MPEALHSQWAQAGEIGTGWLGEFITQFWAVGQTVGGSSCLEGLVSSWQTDLSPPHYFTFLHPAKQKKPKEGTNTHWALSKGLVKPYLT